MHHGRSWYKNTRRRGAIAAVEQQREDDAKRRAEVPAEVHRARRARAFAHLGSAAQEIAEALADLERHASVDLNVRDDVRYLGERAMRLQKTIRETQ